MYERRNLNGAYSGLANAWNAKKIQLTIPRQDDIILSTDAAAKLVAPKLKPSGSIMSENIYWTPEGPTYSTTKIPGGQQPVRVPAPVFTATPAIKVVRDLPVVDTGPLAGWSDLVSNKKLVVLSLLAVGLYLYCKSQWKIA